MGMRSKFQLNYYINDEKLKLVPLHLLSLQIFITTTKHTISYLRSILLMENKVQCINIIQRLVK